MNVEIFWPKVLSRRLALYPLRSRSHVVTQSCCNTASFQVTLLGRDGYGGGRHCVHEAEKGLTSIPSDSSRAIKIVLDLLKILKCSHSKFFIPRAVWTYPEELVFLDSSSSLKKSKVIPLHCLGLLRHTITGI